MQSHPLRGRTRHVAGGLVMLPLFAQAQVHVGPSSGEWGAVGAACAFFGFMAVLVVAGSWQERKKAALAHTERMRRLELGFSDPPPDRAWPKALVCVAVGAGVPLTSFVVTLIAYL